MSLETENKCRCPRIDHERGKGYRIVKAELKEILRVAKKVEFAF